jgi:biopolymer transport protein ExbD
MYPAEISAKAQVNPCPYVDTMFTLLVALKKTAKTIALSKGKDN